jgi:hypothetical protein
MLPHECGVPIDRRNASFSRQQYDLEQERRIYPAE